MISNNVTTVSFGPSRKVIAHPLWQYDYGQILKIEGLALPQAYEVHFSLTETGGTSVEQIGDADGVVIPDALLLVGTPIYAFIFLHTGTDDGETEYKITIPVKARPKPSEEEPTPVQQDAITQAIAALNTAVDEAEGIRDAIPETVNTALEAAKASGEFDGPKGDKGDTGERGETGPVGPQGIPGQDGQDGVSPTIAVTLERWDGVQIDRKAYGAFPDMTPAPEITEMDEGTEETAVN